MEATRVQSIVAMARPLHPASVHMPASLVLFHESRFKSEVTHRSGYALPANMRPAGNNDIGLPRPVALTLAA